MSETTGQIGQQNKELPDQDARPLIKQMQKRINTSTRKWKDEFKAIRRARKYLKGKEAPVSEIVGPVGEELESPTQVQQANVVLSTLQGMMPYLYAKNPEVTVRPSEHVDPETTTYQRAGLFCDTLEIVVNRSLKDAKLKSMAKQAIRDVQSSRVAIVKVAYQTDYYRDPLLAGRQEDLQKKLAEMRGKSQKMEDPELSDDDREANEEIIENQLKSIHGRVDVLRSENLVIDPVPIDDFRCDPNIDTLARYWDAGWMAHANWMTDDQVMANFAMSAEEVKKLNKFQRDADGIPERMGQELARDVRTEGGPDEDTQIEELNCIWELWDRETNSVYTWGEGATEWAQEPFQPERMGERWYPFFLLGFNWLDSSAEFPLSDVELLENLGSEYDSIRKQGFRHRKLSAPHYIADKSRIGDKADITSFATAALGDITLINSAGADPNTVFQPANQPPYNPQIYDTTQIRSDIEWQSGLGDAQRGAVLRSKTATEANIQQQGLGSRVEEKQDSVEDWITDISKFSAEILIQEMTMEKVMRVAGPAAFWPTIAKEELFTMVEVEIRAGSTGKPNKQQELESWVQLMPMIQQNLQFVMQMRGMGVPDKENPYIQLLIETFKRLDERISIEKFLPGEAQGESAADPMQGQVGPDGNQPVEEQTNQMAAQNGGANGANGAGDPAQQRMAQEQQMAAQEQQMAGEQQAQDSKMESEQQARELKLQEQEIRLQEAAMDMEGKKLELQIKQIDAQMKAAEGRLKTELEARKAALLEAKAKQEADHADQLMDIKEREMALKEKIANRPQPRAN